MDVTLGSLLDESLRALEALGVFEDEEDEDLLDDDTNDHGAKEVVMSNTVPTTPATAVPSRRSSQAPYTMQNRGMPYFESMVENSQLGRIKRQKGGHTSRDGRRTVEWEVVEIGGDDGAAVEEESTTSSNKKPRLEA